MLYIITEDEGAGYQFWGAVNRRLLESKAVVVSSKGCGNVRRLLGVSESAVKTSIEPLPLKSEDSVILFLDDTGEAQVETILNTLAKRLINIRHYICIKGIYSFEELILSFSDIEYWIPNMDSLLQKAILEIRKSADTAKRNPYNYWDEKADWVFEFMTLYKQMCSTREQFSKAVLYQFTKYIKSFEIRPVKPSKLGACWYTSCANRTKQGYIKDCEKCGLTNHRLTGAQKLLELNDKSLMSAPGRFTLRDLVKLVKEEG